MTSSYAKATLRRYQETHPWAKKLPKKMLTKKDRPIDLGVIALYDEYGDLVNSEEEARNVGDGAWAIVYDTTREGEWLWELAKNGWADHICSVCRYTVNTDFHVGLGPEFDHCPRCGANMRAEHGVTFTDTNIVLH